MRKGNLYTKKGVAIILIVGILAVLVIIAVAFAVNMRLEFLFAKSSTNSLKAKYLAEAGVHKAISEIKTYTKGNLIDDLNASWCDISDETSFLGSLGRYHVEVFDCQRMVNINNADVSLLSELPGLGSSLATDIVNTRPFETKKEIMRVSGIASGKYNDLKDYITVNSWIYHASGRSPININTADEVVIRAILNAVGVSDVDAAYTVIINNRPFSNWREFSETIDSLSTSDKVLIEEKCNPDRFLTSVVDLCFHYGGYFEIRSTGTLYKTDSQNTVLAQKNITSVVHAYGVLHKTTKADFNEDLNYNGILDVANGDIDADGDGVLDVPSEYKRVNWQDSCPVNSNYDNGLTLKTNYEKIYGSIKLGFWDNFDEDNWDTDSDGEPDIGWSFYNWQETAGNGAVMHITHVDSDDNAELWASPSGVYSLFELEPPTNPSAWLCNDKFSYRVHVNNPAAWDIDTSAPWTRKIGKDDTASVQCTKSGSTMVKLEIGNWGFLYYEKSPGNWDRKEITKPPPYWQPSVAVDPDGEAREGKDFFDTMVHLFFWADLSQKQERFDHIANIFYNIPMCSTGHYDNWIDDMNNDAYHGVIPEEATYRFIVNDDLSPDYRLYLAVGNGWHIYYNYHVGWYLSRQMYPASTSNYINIPVHSTIDDYFDRYGFYGDPEQAGPNAWRDEANGWHLSLYSAGINAEWDEIRIIPDTGYYESPWYNIPEGQVNWGIVSWTVTVPSSADSNSEQISVQIATDSGLVSVANGADIGTTSDRFKFRVNLSTQDSDYSETPVFEGITVVYFIPVEVLYWTELKEEN